MNIARDVEMINRDNEYKAMTIDGSAHRVQQADGVCRKYPQFTEIVPGYITNSSWPGGAWLDYYLRSFQISEPYGSQTGEGNRADFV